MRLIAPLLAIALLPWLILAGCAAPWPMCDRAPLDRPTWNPYAPYVEVTAC